MNYIKWNSLDKTQQAQLLQRPVYESAEKIRTETAQIVAQVKNNGDAALRDYTAKFDQVEIENFEVSRDEIEQAAALVPPEHQDAILLASQQILRNHQAQLPQPININTCDGVNCQRQAKPIRRVGLYVPGGTAPLVSTVMMLAIPAKIANCELRILTTPPNRMGKIDPHILFAAQLCGVQRIFKAGGAQAIAAMAYGTQSIPKVDKLFGPGNAWVTQAKTLVSQDAVGASYDLPAGPSELLIIADASANAEFVAADLLSQAEHGIDSQVFLITTSSELAQQVAQSLPIQLDELPRHQIARQALAHSHIIIVETIEQALELSNQYAPEHLILNITQAEHYAKQVECAGTVFIGPWAAETLGDYVTGSNHVLPTYGYARSVSGLGVADFMTFINLQTISAAGLKQIGPAAEILANIEGLHGHQRAVSLRLAALPDTMTLSME